MIFKDETCVTQFLSVFIRACKAPAITRVQKKVQKQSTDIQIINKNIYGWQNGLTTNAKHQKTNIIIIRETNEAGFG